MVYHEVAISATTFLCTMRIGLHTPRVRGNLAYMSNWRDTADTPESTSVRERVDALDARVTALERRLDPEGKGQEVTSEEASQIGSRFWVIVAQGSGLKNVYPVEVRAGTRDDEGDGDIAYRVDRTDQTVTQGGAVYRRPRDLYRTQAEAEAVAHPKRLSGLLKRTTIKP